jgi:hypothetical protein
MRRSHSFLSGSFVIIGKLGLLCVYYFHIIGTQRIYLRFRVCPSIAEKEVVWQRNDSVPVRPCCV